MAMSFLKRTVAVGLTVALGLALGTSGDTACCYFSAKNMDILQTEALFYVQAPYKVDLPGDLTYQYMWVPMLKSAVGCTPDGLPGNGMAWLRDFGPQVNTFMNRARDLGFVFRQGQRPQPDVGGHIPTTMEWARKLTAQDIKVLRGRTRPALSAKRHRLPSPT